MPVRLCDETGEHDEFPALFLRQVGEMRAIPFDCPQYAHAGPDFVIGKSRITRIDGVHGDIVWRIAAAKVPSAARRNAPQWLV
jgi:hypothetical protein